MISIDRELDPFNVEMARQYLQVEYGHQSINIDMRNALQIALRVIREYQSKVKGVGE